MYFRKINKYSRILYQNLRHKYPIISYYGFTIILICTLESNTWHAIYETDLWGHKRLTKIGSILEHKVHSFL